MNNTEVALALLSLRLAGSVLLLMIMRFQLRLFRKPIDPEYRSMRRLLFVLVLIAFLGNMVPVYLEASILVGPIPRDLGVLYALSNAVTALAIAAVLCALYWLADKLFQAARTKR